MQQLVREIAAVCAPLVAYEVLVIDDGSDDGTGAKAAELAPEIPSLRIIRHDRSGGQSAAVHSGVLAAKADVICTLDGDGQNPPSELPKLLKTWATACTSPPLILASAS